MPNEIRRVTTAAAPLALLLLLPAGLWSARVFRSGAPTYGFLLFNLFLGALPLGFAVWAMWEDQGGDLERSVGRRIRLGVALLLWLLFLPNAPYIISDFIHLRERAGAPLWFDSALVTSCALSALVFGVRSLGMVHRLIERRFGAVYGWASVLVATVLSGFGIWMGRFLRWNSWDALLRPDAIAQEILPRVLAPQDNLRMCVVTLVFASLFFVVYFAFRAPAGPPSPPPSPPSSPH
ncbi:MAG: DUF1361 domain-containing protein [Myxococcota bacterium]